MKNTKKHVGSNPEFWSVHLQDSWPNTWCRQPSSGAKCGTSGRARAWSLGRRCFPQSNLAIEILWCHGELVPVLWWETLRPDENLGLTTAMAAELDQVTTGPPKPFVLCLDNSTFHTFNVVYLSTRANEKSGTDLIFSPNRDHFDNWRPFGLCIRGALSRHELGECTESW